MELQRKLEILADAAKYDASCASSGTELRDSSDGKGLGSTAPGMGICHSYAPDGRCSRALPLRAPPLVREHRLYQADWLMRFYGFAAGEIVDEAEGMLSLDIDPKLAWALRHRDRFPLDVNRASREDLLRVPGFGTKAVDRIIATRRTTSIRAADLARLHIPGNKALPFIVLSDHRPAPHLLDGARLRERFRPKAEQLGFGF
jgi:predicted DNA-binding helix-hairpin-helix protein